MSLYLGDTPIAVNSSSRNIGEIVQSTIPLTDAGLHLLDGSLISSGSYSAFVDYIGDLYDSGNYSDIFETEATWQSSVTTYGVCGKFVYDSVNGTVRLPKITGFTEGTIDPTTLGDLTQAGLPNITGRTNYDSSNGLLYSGVITSGAIYQGQSRSGRLSGASGTGYDLAFDASRSNSIYGNSTTVQPQSIKVLYYIVIATSVKTQIEVDIDEIATDLNGKADVDLTNVNNSGTSLGASWAMPSDTYDTLTVGASGTSYTAPANGYVVLWGRASSNATLTLSTTIDDGNIFGQIISFNTSSPPAKIFMPIRKGETFTIGYSSNVSDVGLRFFYAKGSEWEKE